MFKWKVVGNVLAAVSMGGALAYYNFIDKPPVSMVEVGQACPNFIAKPYKVSEDTFTVSDDVFTLVGQRGKVCVVNFWETWCQACIEELPEFDKIKVEYGDKIEVIAIAGVTSTMESAATWMNNKGWQSYDKQHDWKDFSLTLAYLPTADCEMMGCSGMLPRTIIVDQEGVVTHQQDGAMTYAELHRFVNELIDE